ncbi:hypothetical protein V497_05338 [Pseudogymnoascus sp. VKM F-4516 (FW-969)]|nr:hypothetical protein V497_05338 [Pseudogymnoascus sp. VKM F-4516 (FW-969)]
MALIQIAIVTAAALRILSNPPPLPPHPSHSPLLITLLPTLTTLTTTYLTRLLRPPNLPAFTTLLTLLTTLETALATWAITYLPSSCGLEERWSALYRSKDANAIKRIQDQWSCCGFNSIKDRAWPFLHGENGVRQCHLLLERNTACAAPWGEEEKKMAGVLVGVTVAVFVIKIVVLGTQMRSTAWTRPAWMRFLGGLEADDSRGGIEGERLLIGEGARIEEEYHDEENGGAVDSALRGTDAEVENRPRLEPSGLTGDGEHWRDNRTEFHDQAPRQAPRQARVKSKSLHTVYHPRSLILPQSTRDPATREPLCHSPVTTLLCAVEHSRSTFSANTQIDSVYSSGRSSFDTPESHSPGGRVTTSSSNTPIKHCSQDTRDSIAPTTTQPGARPIPPAWGISVYPA